MTPVEREAEIRSLAADLLLAHASAGSAPGGEFVFAQAEEFMSCAEGRAEVAELAEREAAALAEERLVAEQKALAAPEARP